MRVSSIAPIAAFAVALSGCATPPTAAVNDAKAAVDNAVAAKANEYAPQSLAAVLDARAKLDAELTLQDGHLPMMRSYDETRRLAQMVKTAGQAAEQEAVAGEQSAQTAASTVVGEARVAIQDAEGLLAREPKASAVAARLDAMKLDLANANSEMREAESALVDHQYRDATTRALTAKQTAAGVIASMQHALDVRLPAATRRR